MSNVETKASLMRLLHLCMTCKRENTDEWMKLLVKMMNECLEVVDDDERVVYETGGRIGTVDTTRR